MNAPNLDKPLKQSDSDYMERLLKETAYARWLNRVKPFGMHVCKVCGSSTPIIRATDTDRGWCLLHEPK